jgi:hypothetical protein
MDRQHQIGLALTAWGTAEAPTPPGDTDAVTLYFHEFQDYEVLEQIRALFPDREREVDVFLHNDILSLLKDSCDHELYVIVEYFLDHHYGQMVVADAVQDPTTVELQVSVTAVIKHPEGPKRDMEEFFGRLHEAAEKAEAGDRDYDFFSEAGWVDSFEFPGVRHDDSILNLKEIQGDQQSPLNRDQLMKMMNIVLNSDRWEEAKAFGLWLERYCDFPIYVDVGEVTHFDIDDSEELGTDED